MERTLGQLRAIELPPKADGEPADLASLRATLEQYAGVSDDVRLEVSAELAEVADLSASVEVTKPQTLGELRAIELPPKADGEPADLASLRATLEHYAGASDDVRLEV